MFTADPDLPFVDSVAVEESRLSAVGDAQDAIGPSTRVIDAGGALVTPGFTDAHVHPVSTGLDKLRCSFDDCSSAEGAIDVVARFAAEHPDEAWIRGAGWSMGWFDRGCPSREMLDQVVADRPVFLVNADGHDAWVNSRALEAAGVNSSTPDPADGRIERLFDGSPQGTLHEGAMGLVEMCLPPDTAEELLAGLIHGQGELLRYGITAWQDAIVTPAIQQAYLEADAKGVLIGSVVGALWWDRDRGLEQIDELVERRQQASPRFRPTAVKLMLDGVAENFTASMLEPWLNSRGEPTNNRGLDFIDPDLLGEAVVVLDSLGFQCHFHALGDRAVRQALDAVEHAREVNGLNDLRHHIAHIQFVHPDDIPRFATLDVVANAQPLWACNDGSQLELTKPFVSEERFNRQYPFGALLRAGARLAMGSDWGVSTANVMEEIDVAITRTCGETEPLGQNNTLTPMEALLSFTMGSAYINHAEGDSGSVSVGNLADLVVLDRDPLVDGPFRDAQVVVTISEGRIVYGER